MAKPQSEIERDKLRHAINLITEQTSRRVERGVYTALDAKTLSEAIAQSGLALDRLSYCLGELAKDSPSLALEAWHNVLELFRAGKTIGGLTSISESADAVVLKIEQQIRKPARMREAKAANGESERLEALDEAILACVDGNRKSLNSYRLKMIPTRDEVLNELQKRIDMPSQKKGWPSATTIANRIALLKK